MQVGNLVWSEKVILSAYDYDHTCNYIRNNELYTSTGNLSRQDWTSQSAVKQVNVEDSVVFFNYCLHWSGLRMFGIFKAFTPKRDLHTAWAGTRACRFVFNADIIIKGPGSINLCKGQIWFVSSAFLWITPVDNNTHSQKGWHLRYI